VLPHTGAEQSVYPELKEEAGLSKEKILKSSKF
jgi:hypothetical protein